jgi:peptidoglycan/LPS O-acetylase OafA/YrhL
MPQPEASRRAPTMPARSLASQGARPADGYIPTLDGWRAVAVVAVIVGHFTVADQAFHAPWIWSIVRFGRYGVDLFFAISGLLITSRMLDEVESRGRVFIGAFYVRRAFRILPAAIVFFVLAAVASHLHPDRPSRPLEWVASALFFRNYVEGSHTTGHLWSLSVEEHFYAFWPVVFLVLARRKATGWVFAGLLLLIVWRALVLGHAVPDPFEGGRPIRNDFRTDLRMDALLWGAAAAIAIRDPRVRSAATAGLGRVAWLLAVGTFFAAEFMAHEIGWTLRALASPVILLGTVLRPASLRARVLENGALRWVGRLSYGIYLFQQLFLPWTFGVAFGIAFILPVACVSYYGVERPLLQLGHDLAARRPVRRAVQRGALAIAVGIAGVCAVVDAYQSARLRGVRISACEHDDFRGACVEIGAGPHDLTAPGAPFPPRALSSLRVGDDAIARLCTAVDAGRGSGDCWDVPGGAWYQTMDARNDQVSFIEVIPRP